MTDRKKTVHEVQVASTVQTETSTQRRFSKSVSSLRSKDIMVEVESAEHLFDAIDVDGNGNISKDEFKRVSARILQAIGHPHHGFALPSLRPALTCTRLPLVWADLPDACAQCERGRRKARGTRGQRPNCSEGVLLVRRVRRPTRLLQRRVTPRHRPPRSLKESRCSLAL